MSRRSGTPVTRSGLRLARTAAFGGASLLLAAGAHLAGGGALPGPGVLAALGVVLGLVGMALTRRRLRFPVVLGVLGLTQVVGHRVLDLTARAAACAPVGPHPVGEHAALTCGDGHPASAPAVVGLATVAMTLAHVLATVATAVLLTRGEAWLWRLVQRADWAAHAAPRPTRRRARMPALPLLHSRSGRRSWTVRVSRGPPAAARPA